MDLHEFGFTRGCTKTGGGGEEGMQSKGHICTCPVLLHCFSDICQQVLGLFFTYDATRNLLAGICNHEWKRLAGGEGGGGGGNCCQRGGISYAMGEGGGQLAPTHKAMLDPGLHGTYLDLS